MKLEDRFWDLETFKPLGNVQVELVKTPDIHGLDDILRRKWNNEVQDKMLVSGLRTEEDDNGFLKLIRDNNPIWFNGTMYSYVDLDSEKGVVQVQKNPFALMKYVNDPAVVASYLQQGEKPPLPAYGITIIFETSDEKLVYSVRGEPYHYKNRFHWIGGNPHKLQSARLSSYDELFEEIRVKSHDAYDYKVIGIMTDKEELPGKKDLIAVAKLKVDSNTIQSYVDARTIIPEDVKDVGFLNRDPQFIFVDFFDRQFYRQFTPPAQAAVFAFLEYDGHTEHANRLFHILKD